MQESRWETIGVLPREGKSNLGDVVKVMGGDTGAGESQEENNGKMSLVADESEGNIFGYLKLNGH